MQHISISPRKALTSITKQMKSKPHSHLTKPILLVALLLLLLLIFAARSAIPQPPSPYSMGALPSAPAAKIAPSIARAIVHYATSAEIPQQTFDEISAAARVLERKSPCNFLVFGLGRDSLMWASLNHGGRTVFLEEDRAWIETVRSKFPSLESHHVTYNTRVSQAGELLEYATKAGERCMGDRAAGDVRTSGCPLALKQLPGLVYDVEWDVIMVDAPTGYVAEAPGRMGAIYTAGMIARGRSAGDTDVFVHDVDRAVEDKFSLAFLCKGYLKEQEGRLRHFTIPSHMAGGAMPFCP